MANPPQIAGAVPESSGAWDGFDLTPEQKEWQAAAIQFARSELGEDAIRRDHEEIFSREEWIRCAKFGILGMPVPVEYGGMDLGLSDVLATMEGLGYGSRDQGLLFSINAHLWTNTMPLLAYGNDEQKQKYLPRLSNGELIGANAATEPDAGSDIFSMRTRAERQGDFYILNGAKTFVTNATVADSDSRLRDYQPGARSYGHYGILDRARYSWPDDQPEARENGVADIAHGGSTV